DRFKTNKLRVENREELDSYLNGFFSQHTLTELTQIMEKYGVAHSWVNSVEDIFSDPHIKERENLIPVFDYALNKNITMQGIVPKLSKTPGKVNWAGPILGMHNEEIYSELLNIDMEELNRLKASGVI